jgi:hypothetical protein
VSEPVIRSWLDGVWRKIGAAADRQPFAVDYVCLLGTKKDGRREIWDFYPARAQSDPPERPTFEQLLNRLDPGRVRFRVHHVPTVDHQPVPHSVIAEVARLLQNLLKGHNTVLIGCSAACGRTREVLAGIEWVRSV